MLYIAKIATKRAVCIIAIIKIELRSYVYWTAKELSTPAEQKQAWTIEDVKDLMDVGKYSEPVTKFNQPNTAREPLDTSRTTNIREEGMRK